MQKKYFKLAFYAVPLLLVGLLSGCNSGSGSGSGSGYGSSMNINGQVANGYLYNARVCLDLNDNQRCDDNEPQAWTGREGRFELKNVGRAQSEEHAVVVEVDGNETLIGGVKVGRDFVLEGIPGQHEFVSPFTTMIRQQMRDNGEDRGAARQHIAARLGISESDAEMLQKNYLDQDERQWPIAEKMQNTAGIITRAMAGLEAELPEWNPETADLSEHRARRGAILASIIEEMESILEDAGEIDYQDPDNMDQLALKLVERCREGLEERLRHRRGTGGNNGPSGREDRML